MWDKVYRLIEYLYQKFVVKAKETNILSQVVKKMKMFCLEGTNLYDIEQKV